MKNPLLTSSRDRDGLVPVRVRQFQMGMIVRIDVWAPTEEEGHQACAKAFELVASLNNILSDYARDSEISRLCRGAGGGPALASDELLEVMGAALRLAALTGGRYDPTAAPVIREWRAARREDRLPLPAQIRSALTLVGYRDVVLDPADRTVALRKPGMQLDLGAIAKGYVGDRVVVAPDGMTSDALATAGTLLPEKEFKRLLENHYPGVRAEIRTR